MRGLTGLEQARGWKDLRAGVRDRVTRTLGDTTRVEDRLSLTRVQGKASERSSVLRGTALAKTALHAPRFGRCPSELGLPPPKRFKAALEPGDLLSLLTLR